MKQDIEAVSQWIKSRHSFYPMQMQEGAEIPNDHIWQILENGNYAPSHKRTEPWRYQVFSGAEKMELVEEMVRIFLRLNPNLKRKDARPQKLLKRKDQVSHIIAICMHRDPAESIPVFEEEYAVACSVQNILLSMKSLNIIGYWSTGALAFSPDMHAYLELEEKDKCLGFLLLGVPKPDLPDLPKVQMSSIQDKVWWR